MTNPSVEIRLERRQDAQELKLLNKQMFGPGRFARTAYRVRETSKRDPRLALCAVGTERIIGSVHFTPITVGGVFGGLLLGPLIVEGNHANQGHGLRLMLEGLNRARKLGYKLVILVGDLPYYARAGFVATPAEQIVLPGPVDPSRLLHVELVQEALSLYRGLVRGIAPNR